MSHTIIMWTLHNDEAFKELVVVGRSRKIPRRYLVFWDGEVYGCRTNTIFRVRSTSKYMVLTDHLLWGRPCRNIKSPSMGLHMFNAEIQNVPFLNAENELKLAAIMENSV